MLSVERAVSGGVKERDGVKERGMCVVADADKCVDGVWGFSCARTVVWRRDLVGDEDDERKRRLVWKSIVNGSASLLGDEVAGISCCFN